MGGVGGYTALDLKTMCGHRDEVCKEAGRKTGSKDLVKLLRVKKKWRERNKVRKYKDRQDTKRGNLQNRTE